MKLFTPQESKRWQLAFWIMALAPFVIALLLWAYVDLLKTVGVCSPAEGWPPPCVVRGVDLVGFVSIAVTTLAYGWLFYEVLFFFLFGVIIGIRMVVLKFKAHHEIGARP